MDPKKTFKTFFPMMQKTQTPQNRIIFFDNLRYLMALLVLVFHSGASYGSMVWFSLGNLVQCEVAKLAFYIPYFGLGVYACANQWFTGGKDLGRLWVWGVSCFVLMVVNMLVGRSITRTSGPSLGLQMAFVVLYPLWTLSFLGMFTAFASRHWNYASPLDRELAANSYTMYLTHYVFAMTLPLLLGVWAEGPTLIKFALVALATIILSYVISKYVVRRFPRWVVVGLVGLNVALALLT